MRYRDDKYSAFTEARRKQKARERQKMKEKKTRNMLVAFYSALMTFLLFLAGLSIIHYVNTNNKEEDYYRRSSLTQANEYVWDFKEEVLLDAPLISQLPELPRGCEVTSLNMLLKYAGVNVDKMTLAKQIRKDPAEYQVIEGQVHFGDPRAGFVGCMYDFNRPGFAVFHEPVKELAKEYLPGLIVDLSGGDFEEVLYYISGGVPVWVLINTGYTALDDRYFKTWQTPGGPLDITYRTHAVLLTGYDRDYVYFNDPLTAIKNRKKPLYDFRAAWEQMGRQAITYTPEFVN